MSLEIAISQLARAVATALTQFALDIEAIAPPESALVEGQQIDLPEARGERQRSILALAELGTEDGLKTADIAKAIDYEVPNTYSTLQAMERGGLVEMIAGSSPQRWRLAPRYRTNSPVFARVASRVREGEWTTYGDISIAVRGDHKASRGVGRAAATLLDFPSPHRILMEGGRVNDNWRDSFGNGPDECRGLLQKEGINFDSDGRADPTHRVAWDVLRERDRFEPVAE